jgi:hypothetical protein
MELLKSVGQVGQGVCAAADQLLFVSTKPHVWAPAALAGGLAGGYAAKKLLGGGDLIVLAAAAAGSLAGFGLSSLAFAGNEASKACESAAQAAVKVKDTAKSVARGTKNGLKKAGEQGGPVILAYKGLSSFIRKKLGMKKPTVQKKETKKRLLERRSILPNGSTLIQRMPARKRLNVTKK